MIMNMNDNNRFAEVNSSDEDEGLSINEAVAKVESG